MKLTILLFLVITFTTANAQNTDITESLYETYEKYKENELGKRRIKHAQLQPLIEKYRTKAGFKITKVGESIEGKSLNLISIGEGDTSVFLWSVWTMMWRKSRVCR